MYDRALYVTPPGFHYHHTRKLHFFGKEVVLCSFGSDFGVRQTRVVFWRRANDMHIYSIFHTNDGNVIYVYVCEYNSFRNEHSLKYMFPNRLPLHHQSDMFVSAMILVI